MCGLQTEEEEEVDEFGRSLVCVCVCVCTFAYVVACLCVRESMCLHSCLCGPGFILRKIPRPPGVLWAAGGLPPPPTPEGLDFGWVLDPSPGTKSVGQRLTSQFQG